MPIWTSNIKYALLNPLQGLKSLIQKGVGKVGNRRSKTVVLSMLLAPLHPKVDDAAAATICKTMPVVSIAADAKALMLVRVKGAIAPSLCVQFYVLTDKIVDADGRFNALGRQGIAACSVPFFPLLPFLKGGSR